MNDYDYPNLIDLLSRTVNRYGDRIAFIFDNQKTTYAEFWHLCFLFAAALKNQGIEAGDRIAILLPNIPEYVIAYYGALMSGCIVVPLNIMFRKHEIKYILEDSECKLAVVWDRLKPEISQIIYHDNFKLSVVILGENDQPDFSTWDDFIKQGLNEFSIYQPQNDETAVILYTSGTTGHPRGVLLSHQNISSNTLACVEAGAVSHSDICLGVLPFYHSFGQTAIMNTCIASGSLNVMLIKFEPGDVIRTLQENEVTIFAAVPTMFHILIDAQKEKINLPSIRICLSGAAKLDVNVYQSFYEKFGLPIYEGYGLTEASPVVSFNPMDYRSKIGSVGLPISGVEVKIVDKKGVEVIPGEVGEIILRGPNVMKGYLNRPEATKKVLRNDWLYTGDIGKIDDDGYLYILDRQGDVIIKGGFNVYPKEVERVIAYHSKVKEVAVIGVPDPVQGEEVKAFITLKQGKRVSKKEIIEYCQEHIAQYKCPKYITFLRKIPKSSSGRILKRKLFMKKSKK